MAPKRVLIVGGNFAGIAAARALSSRYRVTVADPGSHLEWLPNVHELVSRLKTAAQLRSDRRRLVERSGHRFLRSAIDVLDAERGEAFTSGGRRLRFEACIVCVGGVDDSLGVPGVEAHARPFKTVAQCDRIGRELARLVRRKSPVRVTIAGGGLEGVEALGEILRAYRQDDRVHVTVVDGAERLMHAAPAAVDAALRSHCEGLAVDLRTGVRVSGLTAKGVVLDDGTKLRSDLTLWTGGVRPASCLQDWGLAGGEREWAQVSPCLQSASFENVFIAGDAAELQRAIAKQAYHALDMGAVAGDNAARWLEGKTLRRFKPAPKPMLVAFGDLDTFLISGRRMVASPALAIAKEAIFQITMSQLDPPLDRAAVAALTRRAASVIRRVAGAAMRPRDALEALRVRVA